VEEVITIGGSAREMVDLIRAHNAVPPGVGALIDRFVPGDSSARRTDAGAAQASADRLGFVRLPALQGARALYRP
jgi:orotate phosphoribosyltransferase